MAFLPSLLGVGRLRPAPLVLCIVGLVLASYSQPAQGVPPKSVVQKTAASCTNLPLNLVPSDASSDPFLTELVSVLGDYETAFQEEDTKTFHSLVHPSLHQSGETSKQIFETLFPSYGLKKPKLTRVAAFNLRLPGSGANPDVDCSWGRIRGVVGPERQVAVFHAAYSSNEQVRLMTLFAQIPEGVRKLNKTKYSVGSVMFHTQTWTHERMTAEKLLGEARKWSALKNPFVAWVYAESAVRLLNSNPYFLPRELSSARNDVEEYRLRGPSARDIAEKMRQKGLPWEFLGFTVVFQASGVEPGLHFRMKPGDVLSLELEKCRMHSAAVVSLVPEMRERFHGVECIPYQPEDDLSKAPTGGTQFVPWNELTRVKASK
jgi:hypothetical protein